MHEDMRTVDGGGIDPQLTGLVFIVEQVEGLMACTGIEPEDDVRLQGRTADAIAHWMRAAVGAEGVPAVPVPVRTAERRPATASRLMGLHAIACAFAVAFVGGEALRGDPGAILLACVAVVCGFVQTALEMIRQNERTVAMAGTPRPGHGARGRAEAVTLDTARAIAERRRES